ncbi:hypothetical protein GCM10025864_35080 [Luteimicrobium album]|uniref:VanZ-like domain-containing protein n=1 Tax=Luteimicrobium album TaxID=1054550 RepID=A0ABQ6I4P0_9MICO|nr:VanZ family protein [Luteimicrobium album]GMA25749.1 hypothetical protein GCM10025864_35080 [Luteimicrobium album]
MTAVAVAGPTRTRARSWLVALFAVYLALLVWLVLWKLHVPWVGSGARRTVKLVPFVATDANGPSQPSEVLGNVLAFVPFGVYLGLIAPHLPWWRRWAWVVGVVALTSAGLEAAQYVLAVGSSDVSDVIANTAGGLVGLVVAMLARRALPRQGAQVLAALCGVVTVLGLLAGAVGVVAPLRYGGPPPDDVHVQLRIDRQPRLDAPG